MVLFELLFLFLFFVGALAEDITELIEGEVQEFTATGTQFGLQFHLYDKHAPVIVYLKSTATANIFACPEDIKICKGLDINVKQQLRPNTQTTINQDLGLQFPGTLFFWVDAPTNTKVSFLVFNSDRTPEVAKLSYDKLDGYDLEGNNGYKFFHSFVCPDTRKYLRMTTQGGSVYGSKSGKPTVDSVSICTSGNSTATVCQNDNPTSGFYGFSVLVDDAAPTYSVMMQTMDPSSVTLDTITNNKVGAFEYCSFSQYIDLRNDQRTDSLMVAAWSKNSDITESVSIILNDNYLDVEVDPVGQGDNYVVLDSTDALDALYINTRSRHALDPFSTVSDNSTVLDYSVIVSHDLIQLRTENPLFVDPANINTKTKNNFIEFPAAVSRPYVLGEFVGYDMVYSVDIIRSEIDQDTDIGVFIDFTKFDKNGTGYKYTGTKLETFEGNNLYEMGHFCSQGIIPAADFPYEHPVPIMTLVNKGPNNIPEDAIIMTTVAPTTNLDNDVPYSFVVYSGLDTLFNFPVLDENQNLELEVTSPNFNFTKQTLTISCSQTLYTAGNTYLSAFTIIPFQKKSFFNLKVEGGEAIELGKKLYCSLSYKSTSPDASKFAQVTLTSHTDQGYVNLYEGSPLTQTMVVETDSDGVKESKNFKLLGDSLVTETGKLDPAAPSYSILFAKVELLAVGERNPDGSLPNLIDEEDVVLFCFSESPRKSCTDEASGAYLHDTTSVSYDTPVDIMEVGVNMGETSVAGSYRPTSTYLVIDVQHTAVAHGVKFIVTVGYAIDVQYKELYDNNFKKSVTTYYNNNNKDTVDNHIQFIKLGTSRSMLLQTIVGLSSGSYEEKPTPNYTSVVGILCPDYPETILRIDEEHECYIDVLSYDNAFANTTLFGACGSSCFVTDWYLSLIPLDMDRSYKGLSKVTIQYETILDMNVYRGVSFSNTKASIHPLAMSLPTKIFIGNSLISYVIELEEIRELTMCFSITTPQETNNCAVTRHLTGYGQHIVDIEFNEDWVSTFYPYGTYDAYFYLTLTGPANFAELSTHNRVELFSSLKISRPINGVGITPIKMTANSANSVPYSDSQTLYFLPYLNDMVNHIEELVLVIVPAQVPAELTDTPDFYKDSYFDFMIYPNTHDVVTNTPSTGIRQVQKGYITYPIGEEMKRRGITDISQGITMVLKPKYETFKMEEAGSDYYAINLGMYYRDTPSFMVSSINQLSPTYSKLFKTDPNTGDVFGPGTLKNYFRITPRNEVMNTIKDITGVIIIPCKGMPTIYLANSSKTATPFPDAETKDEVIVLSEVSDMRNRAYIIDSDGMLNQYININFGADSLVASSKDYSYAVVANFDAICIPTKSQSENIDNLNSFVLDGHSFISIGYNPATIPQSCIDKYGNVLELEYTMYYYKLETTLDLKEPEDIPISEVQPTSCGMQEYGFPAMLNKDGTIQWSKASDERAAILRSNQDFYSPETGIENDNSMFVFNILGRIKGVPTTKYALLSYSGLIVPSSKFLALEDGHSPKEYKELTSIEKMTISPSVVPFFDRSKFFFYANKYYFQVEVTKVNNGTSAPLLVCINQGDEKCSADPIGSPLMVNIDAVASSKASIIFDLQENEEAEGVDSITHYSAMFGPELYLHPTLSVDLKVFGASVHELFSDNYFSAPTTSYHPTKYFVRMSDDTNESVKSIDLGMIDLRINSDEDKVSSLPNIDMDISFDVSYLNNSELISGDGSFGASVLVCSDHPLTDPGQVGNRIGGEAGDSCMYVAEIKLNKTSAKSSVTQLNIPFGHNKATDSNSVYVNGQQLSLNNPTNQFNIKREAVYFVVFITNNVLQGFEWQVTTKATYPIDITTVNAKRHLTAITTPTIFVGKDLFMKVYNDDPSLISSGDKCGMFIYPKFENVLTYDVSVCVSSTVEFPLYSKDQCDIYKGTITDASTYVPFNCKNAASTKGTTYFGLQFAKIGLTSSSFILQVVRSSASDLVANSRTISFADIIHIDKVGDKYFCGDNPIKELDVSGNTPYLPKECFIPFALFQDMTVHSASPSFNGLSVTVMPSETCAKCFDEYSISNGSLIYSGFGITTSYVNAGEPILNVLYNPESTVVNKGPGSHATNFSLDQLKDSEGTIVKYVGMTVTMNDVQLSNVIEFYNDIIQSNLVISMTLSSTGTSNAIITLDGDTTVADTTVLASPTLMKNTPSYLSMFMTTETNNVSRITVSPCIGNPTVYGSPFDTHPKAASAKYIFTDTNSSEFDISVTGDQTGVQLHDVLWYFNILTSTDDTLRYELYPNNNHLRPSCVDKAISMLTPTPEELENKGVKFAVEFTPFGIPYEVLEANPAIEIRYRLYGFTNEYTEATPLTACAAKLSGESVFVNLSTGTDYLALNNTANTGKLRILGNKAGVNFKKVKYVQVVGEYTMPNGVLLHTSSGYVGVKVYEGFPWWAILIIVLLVLILVGGIIAAVVLMRRHKKRQGDYLLNANDNENENEAENPEDGEYVANFDTMN